MHRWADVSEFKVYTASSWVARATQTTLSWKTNKNKQTKKQMTLTNSLKNFVEHSTFLWASQHSETIYKADRVLVNKHYFPVP